MTRRSAIETDLFADTHHRAKLDKLGDPLAEIESSIDFAALATEVDRMSYKRFCGPAQASNMPDRTTVWTFDRIGEAGAQAIFDGAWAHLLKIRFHRTRRPGSTPAGETRN